MTFRNGDDDAPVDVHEGKVFIRLADGSSRWLQAGDGEILDTLNVEWVDGRLRVWETETSPLVREKPMLLIDGIPQTYIDPDNTLVVDPRGRIHYLDFGGMLQQVRLGGIPADIIAFQSTGELYLEVDGVRRWLEGGGRPRLTAEMLTCAFGELLLRADRSFVHFPKPPEPEKKAHPEAPSSGASGDVPAPWEAAEIGGWGPLEAQTLYLGAHGARIPPDTFVPEGMTALFYADLDMAMPQVYSQLALSGRFDPRKAGADHAYGAGDRIPNYLLTRISDAEQVMLRQGSLVPEEQWIFVGDGVIPDRVTLCTSPDACWPDTGAPPPPEHHRGCRGLLGMMRVHEIYLTACRNWPGNPAVTSHVAGDQELPKILLQFKKELIDAINTSPDEGIPRFLTLPPVSRSMILSASPELAEYFDSLVKSKSPSQYQKIWAKWENRADELRLVEEFQSSLNRLKRSLADIKKIKGEGEEKKRLRFVRKEMEKGVKAADEILAYIALRSATPWWRRWIQPGVPQGSTRSAAFQNIMRNALQGVEDLDSAEAREVTTGKQIHSMRRDIGLMREAAQGLTRHAARQTE
ncbi:putative adhesin [Streptomyces sp. NPDC047028]|uniref:putative adhesin n=1 Tax=Streptomyces sp. NPDC047028 TaxID=3155793 RepID=UPI003410CC55